MASALLEPSPATAGAPQTGAGTRAVTAVSRRQARHHKCAYCPRGFKRSEHRLRHERTHTHEKPFSCRHCNKSYSRKDLVVRHERTLHAQEHNDEQSTGGSLSSPTSTQDRSPIQSDDSVRPKQPLQNEPRQPRSNTRFPSADEPSADGLSTINIPDQSFMTPLGDLASANACSTSHDDLILPLGSDISNYLGDLNDFMFDGEYLAMCDTSTTSYPTNGYLQQILGANDTPEVCPNVHPRRESASLSTATTKLPPPSTSPPTSRAGTSSDSAPESLLSTGTSRHHQIPSSSKGHGDAAPCPDGAFTRSYFDAAQRNNRPPGPSGLTRVAQKPLRGLPHLRESTPRSAPHLNLDEDLYASLSKDLACRLDSDDPLKQLPHAGLCHAFLNSYIQCFDLHFPMVHWPTLDIKSTPSPLIFSMCSIGALYRLDHRRARVLYDLSLRALSTTFPCMQTHESFLKHEPIWAVQAKILLSIFSMLSGEEDLTSASMNEHAFYTLVYGKQRQSLSENTLSSTLSWADWVRRETWKRLLGVIYISSTLYMIIYGINPGFNATTDLEYEVSDDEDLWKAASASEWLELRAQRGAARSPSLPTMKDVLQCILSDNTEGQSEQAHVWPFAMLVLTHGVVVHTWQIFQVMQTCTQGTSSSPDGSNTFASRILDLAITSLGRCKALLVGNERNEQDLPDESQVTCPLFTSRSVLRVAYSQLFKTAVNFNRFNLYAQDPVTIESQLSLFANEPIHLKRSPQLVEVIRNMLEGMSIPVRMGYMLVRKTACFRWSVEHAAVNWDTALFITKWVHCVEMDALRNLDIISTEGELLTEVRGILSETDIDIEHTQSLAAGLARTWAWFLQDVWVWGITPRLGAVLDQLASAYERFHKSHQSVGTNK